MSDPTDATDAATPRRGEAAWKDYTERIAHRNAEAKRLGKARRLAYEEGRENTRRAAEGREMARFIASRRTP